MMLWLKLAIRELHINRGFSTFFLINLGIGLAGFIAIHSFSESLNQHLNQNLKEILTADFVVSSNRPFTKKDREIINSTLPKGDKRAEQVVFYTMIRGNGKSRLAQMVAIDDAYPLYGQFNLDSGKNKIDLQTTPQLLMTKDTARSFGIATPENSPLNLGQSTFYVNDFFTENPNHSLSAIDIAPSIYMGKKQLDGTGLIQFGSRIRYFIYFLYPDGTDVNAITSQLKSEFTAAYDGQPMVNIFDVRAVNRQLGRITANFTGYLGLVSIVALFLAGIATAYLFRGYLGSKRKEIAILMSIGAKRSETFILFSLQLILLGLMASILAVFLSTILLPIFPVVMKGIIPAGLDIQIHAISMLIALGMGFVGSFIFCLPIFTQIFNIKPLFLLRGISSFATGSIRQKIISGISFLPAILTFWGLSIFLTQSTTKGSFFTVGFLVVLVALSAIGYLVFSLCKPLSRLKQVLPKIAFRNLYRNKLSSLSCFVTIAMGTFLISIIPQIQNGLQQEIERPDGLSIPAFFLMDVQEEQKQPLIQAVEKESATLTNLSPIVLGRILKINDEKFHDRRQNMRKGDQNEFRRQRLEYIFSYREQLDVSETIIFGRPISTEKWDFGSNEPFEISVAQRFAEWNRLTIGDSMTFDVQGIELTGKVKNIRKVRWNSFQPNFFLQFQNGVLNDAPKTYMAALSGIPPKVRQDVKNNLVEQFPNLSVLDVTQTVSTILGITNRLSLSITFMAALAIAAGLVSIFSIARQEARKQEMQINLLKVLGAGFKDIHRIVMLEFGFLGFTAALFAILLSVICSYGISLFFFDRLWQLNWGSTLLILTATTVICILTARFATRAVIKSKAVKLLNAE